MEYVSTKVKMLITCILLAIICALFAGCDPYYRNYPFQEEATWICEEPYMQFVFSKAANGVPISEEYLIWNGEKIQIDVSYQASMYCVDPKGSIVHDERLFTGEWKYRKGALVFSIKEDFIFGNQYEELIFYRQD